MNRFFGRQGREKMIRKLMIVSLVCSASVLAFAGAMPKEIQARYQKLHTVIRTVNYKSFATFFAPDFINVDPQGKSATLKGFLAGVKPLFDMSTKATLTEKFLDVKKHDGVIDVKTDLVVDMMGKAGKTHVHEACTDTWKMVGKQWLMIKTVDTKFDVVMPKPKKTDKSK